MIAETLLLAMSLLTIVVIIPLAVFRLAEFGDVKNRSKNNAKVLQTEQKED